MSIVNALDILNKATKGGYAVGAFNITSIMQMQAVIEAAAGLKAPVIIQTSESPAKMISPEVIAAAYRELASRAGIPVALHLDHSTDVAFCKRCIDAGYTNIMIDASSHPYDDNVRITKEVVDYARAKGNATVEGELGTVSGVEDQVVVAENDSVLCDPDLGISFSKATGIDLLAPAIGTAHGIYKTENPKIDVERMHAIRIKADEAGMELPLVIHGGTGLSEEIVERLIAAGGSKYNVSTELKYAWIDGAAAFTAQKPLVYNPNKLMQSQMEASAAVVIKWIKILGSEGKGGANA
jgi:ketose-bisphosphate aldolase